MWGKFRSFWWPNLIFQSMHCCWIMKCFDVVAKVTVFETQPELISVNYLAHCAEISFEKFHLWRIAKRGSVFSRNWSNKTNPLPDCSNWHHFFGHPSIWATVVEKNLTHLMLSGNISNFCRVFCWPPSKCWWSKNSWNRGVIRESHQEWAYNQQTRLF